MICYIIINRRYNISFQGRMRKSFAAVAGFFALAVATAAHAEPRVVASILPVHSLVAGVMEGVGVPGLLVPVGQSPHTYALKPSDARALQSAEVVFWIGGTLENFLEAPLGSLARKASIVELGTAPGVTLLPARKGGVFEDDDDGDQDSATDPHVWLDPENARHMVSAIVTALSAKDAANAARYAANGTALEARLQALDQSIRERVAPMQGRAYIVFHDAYQYFEHRYGTRIVGSITLTPDQAPGARRLTELRHKIATSQAACVFREPQFPAPVVDTVLAGTQAKSGVLDPEGADMAAGPEAYFLLMNRIADSLVGCLKPDA
jgi:zinc transport system substrate-binding protein